MRAGSACASHQTLSAEAASVLKHSLSLARRRGHGQVTPLHVAATLLTSRASLLRRACLRSQPHQHPLQCRALELCFNVALNRLPATPGPLLAAQPSLSNALVAALKRAQAHQRRGCVEQQQPLAPVKVDLDQIVVSILDDPSVSRVMREAGFSSAAVKNHLEDAANSNSVFHCYNINNTNTSGGIYSTPNSPPPAETFNPNPNPTSAFLQSYASDRNPFLLSPPKKPTNNFPSEDVKTVMEALLRNKNRGKNTVVVGDGDSLPIAETVVAEIMERVERGNVSEGLKSAHFIKLELSSAPIRFMKRDEVVMNITELKKKVDSFGSSSSGGVVICTGDLRWAVDDDDDEQDNDYRPVEHLVAEIGKLLSSYSNINGENRVWLMGSANYQTYIKCQMKQPPLDVQWALQAVSVPTGGLGLSLSGKESRINLVKTPEMTQSLFAPDEVEALTCCPECKSNYEREASFKSIQHKSSPLNSSSSDVECSGSPHLPFWLKPYAIGTLLKDDLIQLRRKYNKLCHSLHKGSHSNSMISNQRDYSYPSSYTCLPNKKSLFADSETILFGGNYPPVKTNRTASSLPRFRRQQSCHIDFSFSNGSSKCDSIAGPNLDSLKVSDDKEVKITLALGNLKYNEEVGLGENNNASLVKLFQENVPWQSEIIPSILGVLSSDDLKTKCGGEFILMKGNDEVGKRRIAVGIAEFVLGSSDFLFRVNMRKGVGSLEKMEKALRDLEKVVFLVEDVGCGDCELFSKFFNEGYERGSGRAIFILTIDEKNRRDKDVKERIESVIQMKLVVDHGDNLDHNKRKVDWDFPVIGNKSQRKNEISTGALDLNMEVDDDQEEVEIDGELRFLDKIKNRFVLNMDSDKEGCGKEMFLHKLKRGFEEVKSNGILSSFGAEDKVLEEVFKGSGLYLNTLFEKWIKEVFQTSLRRLDSGEGERVSIRLCLGGGKEWSCHEGGYMGTCLPKSIQL